MLLQNYLYLTTFSTHFKPLTIELNAKKPTSKRNEAKNCFQNKIWIYGFFSYLINVVKVCTKTPNLSIIRLNDSFQERWIFVDVHIGGTLLWKGIVYVRIILSRECYATCTFSRPYIYFKEIYMALNFFSKTWLWKCDFLFTLLKSTLVY